MSEQIDGEHCEYDMRTPPAPKQEAVDYTGVKNHLLRFESPEPQPVPEAPFEITRPSRAAVIILAACLAEQECMKKIGEAESTCKEMGIDCLNIECSPFCDMALAIREGIEQARAEGYEKGRKDQHTPMVDIEAELANETFRADFRKEFLKILKEVRLFESGEKAGRRAVIEEIEKHGGTQQIVVIRVAYPPTDWWQAIKEKE